MKEPGKAFSGHLLAVASIGVWGSTFIFSKTLLEVYDPLQIMALRFVIAYAALWCLHPRVEKTTLKDNLGILAMALFGNTLYFLCENNALRYTLASNVSIIVASAPMWTALLAHFFVRKDKLGRNMAYGSVLAFIGVALVVFNGTVVLKFNPVGDLFSLGAAMSWAVYSVIVVRYNSRFSSFFLMRRLTLFGLILTVPLLVAGGGLEGFDLGALAEPRMLGSILFLGVLGSGLAYVTWNMATRALGVIRVNSYIYLNPFVTMIAAGVFLGEPITAMGVTGALLIIGGLAVGMRR